MTTHIEAKQIADDIPGITEAGSMLVRIIASLESHYGDGFDEGNNWGAVTAGPLWDGETFSHRDSRYDEKTGKVVSYVTQFRSYESDADAAADLWQVLQESYAEAVRAAEEGRWSDVSRALYGYYLGTKTKEAAIADHGRAMRRHAAAICRATGEDNPFGISPRTGTILGLGFCAAGALFVAGALRRPR